MGCAGYRELLSADMDGQADPEAVGPARAHLATCADCAGWYELAARVNRLARTAPADPSPGLTDRQLASVLDQLPRPHRRRWHLTARWALAGVGAAQLALSLLALLLPHTAAGHAHHSILGADLAHMSHESSAWNLALGVAFLAGARWVRHLAGVLPVLGSFVLVLSLVSAVDLVGGNVDAPRVVAHALVLAGLGLIVLIVSTGPSRLRPFPIRQHTRAEAEPAEAPAYRLERRERQRRRPDPAARHHAA
ncbi:zf-HC2 domain-containing protein [Pseudonocardia acaciae]|uniref:zf-HC2 domain-containing protein n=1 Tax=Pseudonocardia acaciae TaxID=551276 RepID=UPI000A6B126B|nr:zf-HC2 domain-containing protein [Pseudonocardia acaciae]